MGVRTFLKRADEAVQDTKSSVTAAVGVAIVALVVAVVGIIIAVVRR